MGRPKECAQLPPTIDISRLEQLKAMGELPSPRGVALAVLRLLDEQDDVSLAELARLLGGDPACVGRLVKAANGIIAPGRRPIASVQEALLVLGIPAVRAMVVGFSLLADYRKGACRDFDYNGFWSFSLVMALSMQCFAQRTRIGAPDELFCLGLLARVGELALATVHPAEYGALLKEMAGRPGAEVLARERQLFAMTHVELGAAMLADWRLPGIFIEAASRYGRDGDGRGDTASPGGRSGALHRALLTAHSLAALCLARDAARPDLLAPLMARGAALGWPHDDIAADCVRIGREWEDWSRLLRLRVLATPLAPALFESEGDADMDTAELPPATEGVFAAAAVDGVAGEVADGLNATRDARQADDLATGQHAAAASLRALVVGPDAASREASVAALQAEGLAVETVADGREGFQRLLEQQPRLVVLAGTPAGMDALRFTRALRQTREGNQVYVLLLSGETDEPYEQRLFAAAEAGADDCLMAPVAERILSARLRAGLRVVRLQYELAHERENLRRFAAELAISNRRLHEAALTDSLTGFRNRRYAHERLDEEWLAAVRTGRPLACLVIDFDGLKQVNDTYGHDAGDRALRHAADALRAELRGKDVICRVGGDEFLAICPDTGLDAALVCAERLRNAVSAVRLQAGGREFGVSISVGVAVNDKTTPDVDALRKLADRGAYVAKRNGRNSVATVQRLE